MTDIKAMLVREAKWQRSRSRLSWSEKLRQAEEAMDGIRALRRGRKGFEPRDATPGGR